MLKRLPIALFLIGITLFSNVLFSQTELEADGGSFEELTPWGEGYLGIVQTQAYAVMPKYRQFQYFDKSGKMVWNQKITPFNFKNTAVCNNMADYAYFINMPFSKTAALEKTSKTEFLNIYQLDRSGKIIEKSLNYTGSLKPLAGYLKDMSTSYIGATQDGFIIVVTNDELKYHIIRVDNELNATYQSIDFKWDEKLYLDGKLSKPKFVLSDTDFTMVQLKWVNDKIETTFKTMKLSDISTIQTAVKQISFDGYSLFSKNGYEIEYSIKEHVFTSYTREDWKGNTIYIIPTLGAFLEFVYTENELKSYAYFRNVNASTKKIDKEGFLLFDLSGEETEIKPNYTFYFEGGENGSKQHAIHIGKKDEFVFISQQAKNNFLLLTSSGEEKKYDEKLSIGQIFASYVSGLSISESTEVDCVSKIGNNYIGMHFDGSKNSLGNSKRVIVYTY